MAKTTENESTGYSPFPGTTSFIVWYREHYSMEGTETVLPWMKNLLTDIFDGAYTAGQSYPYGYNGNKIYALGTWTARETFNAMSHKLQEIVTPLPAAKVVLAAAGENVKRWNGTAWVTILDGLTEGQDVHFVSRENKIYIVNGADGFFRYGQDSRSLGTTARKVNRYIPLMQELIDVGPNAIPQDAKFIATHYSRIWLASTSGEKKRVYMSDVGAAIDGFDTEEELLGDDTSSFKMMRDDYFPVFNAIDIPCQDGDTITGFVVYQDRPHIFTRKSIWTVYGAVPADYQLVNIRSDMGCVSHRSIVEKEGLLFFLSELGPVGFDGTRTFKLYQKIPSTMGGVDKDKWKSAAGVAHNDSLYLALPETISNDMVLEFDLFNDLYNEEQQKSWIPHRGFIVTCFLVDLDGNLLFGSNNGYVYKYGAGHTDDGSAYNAIYTTKALGDMGDNRFRRIRTMFDAVTDGEFTLRHRTDFGDWIEDTVNMGGATVATKVVTTNVKGYTIQFQVEHDRNEPFVLQAIDLEVIAKRILDGSDRFLGMGG